MIIINVYAIVGSDFCCSENDGNRVYNQIKKSITNTGKQIDISFKNINGLTCSFLNIAIGKLYKIFPAKTLKDRLNISSISDSDKILIKNIIDTAKQFYDNY